MRAALLSLAALAACAAPELGLPDDPAIVRAQAPALLPLEEVLGPAAPARIAPGTDAALAARAAALRDRAATLRARALDDRDRERIRAAQTRLGPR